MNDCFDTLERIVINIHVFQCLAHTGNHGCQILDVTHFLDLLYLAQEVVKIKLVLGYLLLQLHGLFSIKLLLCFLHQRNNIPHTQDTVCHTLGMEYIQGFQFLARSDKLDRFVYNRTNRQSGTTASITVQFRQYNPVKIQAVIKLLRCVHGILSGHGIHHEKGFFRFNRFFDCRNLVHHLLVDSKTSGSIDDNHVFSGSSSFFHGVLGNLHGIVISHFAVYRHPNLLSQHFQLLDSSRTVHVAGNQ